MKISNRQAEILAQDILKRIKSNPVSLKVDAETEQKLKEFVDERRELTRQKNEIVNRINSHDASLYRIVGKSSGIYGDLSLNQMLNKLSEKKYPSAKEIEDKIILQSMFSSEEDMEKFIEKIVSSYTKKKKTAPQLN